MFVFNFKDVFSYSYGVGIISVNLPGITESYKKKSDNTLSTHRELAHNAPQCN